MRKAGVDRPQLQAIARQFGRVSWTAMGVALITGVIQLLQLDIDTSLQSSFEQRLFVKLLLVGAAVALALGHQLTARRTSPAVRGVIQGVMLLVSLGIFATAVRCSRLGPQAGPTTVCTLRPRSSGERATAS
jgi:hypothetical protein